MKTNNITHEVTTNVGERGNFTIKANGKAFRVLINGLYANKIQSITREIWSNALDAHAMAGCADRPFEISFPTAFDPSFRVRDYGVSLTHEQVMHMYTTLFESTKEDTNEQVGKLGLGSKSPFAYTDSFSVTVVLNGEKRFYAAMIGPDDVPAINFMGREDTDEENGVEVSFPVEKSDVQEFAQAANRVSMGFDVKPLVSNTESFRGWPEMDAAREGNGWKILTRTLPGHRSTSYAKMGCVLYPINPDAMGDISAEVRAVLSHTCVIDFPIGDLEITASREELSYGRNEPTRDSILRRAEEILAVIRAEAETKFAGCKSLWEAACIYYNEVKTGGMPEFYKKLYARYANFHGQVLDRTFAVKNFHGMDVMHYGKKDRDRKAVSFRPASASLDISPDSRLTVIFEDCTSGRPLKRSNARIGEWRRGTTGSAIWVRLHTREAMKRAVYEIMETFDGATFINLDDIEPPVIYREHTERRPVMVRQYSSGEFKDAVDLSDEEFEEGGIYVPLERMQPVIPEGASRPGVVITRLINAGALDATKPIYGAPKSLQKRFEGEGWTNLYDFANEWLDENVVGISALSKREEALDTIRSDGYLVFLQHHVAADRLGVASPAAEVVSFGEMIKTERAVVTNTIYQVANALGRSIHDEDAPDDILMDLYREVIGAAETAYPFLFAMYRRASMPDNAVDLVTDYVIICDSVRETNQQAVYQIAAE